MPLSLTIVTGHPRATDRGVGDQGKPLAGAVVGDLQDPKPTAIGELFGDEVQAPALVGRRRRLHRPARGQGSLIFTGASGSLRGKANFAPFAAAKAAVRNLAQSLAREFGPQGIHVGHVVVDGGIAGERLLTGRPGLAQERGPDGMLDIDAIAEAYWMLHHQHRSAWTLELDLRPWSESF